MGALEKLSKFGVVTLLPIGAWAAREATLKCDRNKRPSPWINDFGRYYPSVLVRVLNQIYDYLVRCIVQ
jgi:hypothetical protein